MSKFVGYRYWLYGAMGSEKVVIRDGKNKEEFTLSKEEAMYEAENSRITIEFTNDLYEGDNRDRNVYFRSETETDIKGPMPMGTNMDINIEAWNCGSYHEKRTCNFVRDGLLAWGGAYSIVFGKSRFLADKD